nr:ribonuclease E/G [Ramlibacter sp.]
GERRNDRGPRDSEGAEGGDAPAEAQGLAGAATSVGMVIDGSPQGEPPMANAVLESHTHQDGQGDELNGVNGAGANGANGNAAEGEGRRGGRSRDRYGRDRRERGDRAPREDAGMAGNGIDTEGMGDAQPQAAQPQEAQPQAAQPQVAQMAFDMQEAAPATIQPAIAVQPIVSTAPAAQTRVAAPPQVQRYELPLDQLAQVAESSGLQWVNSDAEKIAAVQAAMAAEPKPAHVPRERPPMVVVSEGPLVLVETKRDLSSMKF